MRKILRIAQREYVETVKTKTFIFSVLFAPALMVAIIFFSSRVANREQQPRPAVRIAFSDRTGELAEAVETAFEEHNRSNPAQPLRLQPSDARDPAAAEDAGRQALRAGELDAFVVLEAGLVEGTGRVRFYTYQTKASVMEALWSVERLFQRVVTDRRYQLHNISPAMIAQIRNVPVDRIEVGTDAGDQQVQGPAEMITRLMVPFAFMFLIYFGIVGIGQQMLNSVIEEKNSRIIEVLLSTVSPFELMAGKILGLAGIGFTIMTLWAAGAYGTARWQGLEVQLSAGLLVYLVVYYILGFLLYSALLAGVGSICNTLKETQSLMMPVILLFIVPFISWHEIVQNPDGLFARGLSFLPPLTPLVMILRISSGASVGPVEIAASIVLLAATVLVMIWLAGKIFRTGILMYGKRPSVREMIQWVREK